MLKAIGTGIFALLLPVAVAAQSVGGSYTVAGTNPDGSLYTGVADIRFEGGDCKVTMTFGNGEVSGTCLNVDGVLATSYVAAGALTLVLYHSQAGGVLDGIWTVAGNAGTGREVLTPK